jgi:predicted ATP-dependent endonuclease of OLD family
MQGIFRLAGLWEKRETIFNQNDMTSRQLATASTTLTRILNDQWNQGRELKWKFEHTGTNGDTIIIKIEDPAISQRFTRPSLRSSGFKTYFLLSMIVYARSQNPAKNKYIYLFDEPGTYLHPSAQLDLQRSFEAIADNAQIVYTTHSLFLISKNYPVRNRVISKTSDGTKIDQKPFSRNWKSVRQSLGILLSNNFLIAEKTLLVEGPSDIVYLLDALRKLKATGAIDIDLNDMSIVDAGNSQNYVALAKLMLSEGRNVVALLDGDQGGKNISAQLSRSCTAELQRRVLQIHHLPENTSTENIFADLQTLKVAIRDSWEALISEGARERNPNVDPDAVISGIGVVDGITLGATIDTETATLFLHPEKISKLLIAIKYEDRTESSEIPMPEAALPELKKISALLNLRGEKARQSGIFEDAS